MVTGGNVMRQVNLRLPVDIVERVDVVRGGVPRQVWLRGVVERELGRGVVAVDVASGFAGTVLTDQEIYEASKARQRGVLADRVTALAAEKGLVEPRSFGGDLRGGVGLPVHEGGLKTNLPPNRPPAPQMFRHLPTCRCGVCVP